MVTFCLISKRCSCLCKLTFSIIEVSILVRQTDTILLLLHETNFLFQVVLAGAFYPNYFTFGQPDEEMAVRELAGKDPKTTIVVGGEDRSPSRAWATGAFYFSGCSCFHKDYGFSPLVTVVACLAFVYTYLHVRLPSLHTWP